MARSFGRGLLLVVSLLLAAGSARAGDGFKQWMGCGYGPGYNAPVPPGKNCGLLNNWGRGCCEVPASWRLHVWDGYHGDPADYQRSLAGAQPDINHMPISRVYGGRGLRRGNVAGNDGGNVGASGACSNCQSGGGYSYPATLAPTDAIPGATEIPPDVESSRATSSIREQR